MLPIDIYRFTRRYIRDYNSSGYEPVKAFNCFPIPKNWLSKFIIERGVLKNNSKKTVSVFSVNGDRFAIDINKSDFKIFYTGENVHVPDSHWEKYNDLLLNKKSINLSLGFDYIEHEKYLRFPLWLMYFFNPASDIQAIKTVCENLNHPPISIEERIRFCSFICRNDYFGDRIKMFNQINQIEPIDCGGVFMHNDDDLMSKYQDNKLEYLKRYRFNLCPENSNNNGYVTEKIFEAINSGCIPIYWGSDNNPEPDILNKNAVFFIQSNHDSPEIISEIKRLNDNPKLYMEFAEQNRLLNGAPEIIYNFFEALETKLIEIIKQ
jgi:hypothetical protein